MSTEIAIQKESVSEHSISKRWLTFPAAIGFLLFLVVFFNSTKGKITEPDIWWHLRNADHIISTHSFPRFDQYSFTASGTPWIDHEWLSELAYLVAFRIFGLRGMFVLFATLAAAIFILLYHRCRHAGANPKTASIIMALGILVASVSFGPRALLFGWLCMSALLFILERFSATRSAPLWVLPPLFCLWINLHGSWLFGVIVLATFIASGLIKGEWGRVSAEPFSAAELKKLTTVAALAIAALFVNPFGYRLVGYPFDLMFRQQTNIRNIEEWQSVDFHDPRGKLAMLLLLTIFASVLGSRRRFSAYETLIGAFALYTSLTYWRMQFFAALIFVPLISARLPLFPPYDVRKEKPLLNGTIMLGVIALLVLRFPSEATLHRQIADEYPEGALTFMHDKHITNRVLNHYSWGGYMIWHTPDIKVFIDGRADIYAYTGILDDYIKLYRLQDTLKILDRYRLQYVLYPPNTPLAYLLRNSSCWQQIYGDNVAVLYQRDSQQAGCNLPAATVGSTSRPVKTMPSKAFPQNPS